MSVWLLNGMVFKLTVGWFELANDGLGFIVVGYRFMGGPC